MYVYAISTQLGVEDRTQTAVLALRRDLVEGGGMEWGKTRRKLIEFGLLLNKETEFLEETRFLEFYSS